MISTIHLADKMRGALAMDPMKQHEVIAQPYDYAALLIMGAAFIVGFSTLSKRCMGSAAIAASCSGSHFQFPISRLCW